MFHRWAALVLVLALCAMTPRQAAGQTQSQAPRGHKGGIGQNYPNPFNPETFIPFTVCDTLPNGDIDPAKDDGRQHAVTVEILNILAQQVATPVLQGPGRGSTTIIPPSLNNRPIRDLMMACGKYVGYWDGNYQGTTKEAASGIYVARFKRDGTFINSIRMLIRK